MPGRLRLVILSPFLLLLSGVGNSRDAFAAGGNPAFRTRPATRKKNGKVEIRFSVARPTDVAVVIEDAKGKVVRHLAAGVLGKNPPPPLKPGSLEQSVEWDGRDDLGRPATGGPFRARVSLGLKPELDGFFGFDPADYNPLAAGAAQPLDSVRALATGPGGELFAFRKFGAREMECNVFSRRGRYLRTILPYPADLPEEKLKGLKRIELENGLKVPFIYQGATRSLFPGASCGVVSHRAVATKDGRIAFMAALHIDAGHGRETATAVPRLAVLYSDGSVPPGGPLRTKFERGVSSVSLALSPDERTIYAVGARKRGAPTNVVYRFGWKDEAPRPFVRSGLNDPKGVAVDRDGNVYVADKGNDRVAVFKPDGSLLGALKVEKPERVEVHPRTRAVYVLGGANINQLLKFNSWKAARPAARAAIPSFRHRDYTAVLALDASGDPPVLWVSSAKPYYARFALLRTEDKGSSFGEQVDIAKLPAKSPLVRTVDVTSLSFARAAGVLNIGSRFYDVREDKFVEPPDAAVRKLLRSTPSSRSNAGSFGLDGKFYFQLAHTTLRLGPDLKVLPFPRGECDAGKYSALVKKYYGGFDKYGGIGSLGGSARCRERGTTADLEGNVYALTEKGWSGNVPGPDFTALSVYNPDGSPKKLKLIDADIRGLSSVRVDPRGNIYLAMSLRPGKDLLPPGLKGKLPESRRDPDAVRGVNYYPLIYGSVAKFGPEGGLIQKNCGGVECSYAYSTTTEVKGAKWIRAGITDALAFRTPGGTGNCACGSPRFDVDGFGRVFFPDAGRFRVWVLDTGGNEICWFGSYGNADSGGPGSAVPVPEIPLCWPQAVAVDDGKTVYVGDRLNRRVVKVRLTYRAEETCALP